MKNKFFKVALAMLLGLATLFSATLCAASCKKEETLPPFDESNESYTESTERINNPDQGFYRPLYVRLTENGASFNQSVISDFTQLYHLRIDISAFSANAGGADKPITDAALDGLKNLLNTLYASEKSAVVRFAYDKGYEGHKDYEPPFDVLLNHIAQFAAVVNKFPLTVTAVEAGLIGPWGEMHSSKIANKNYITPMTEKLLTEINAAPVLVRTPQMIYDYLGISVKDAPEAKISEEDKAYRLGIFNDGYLGSETDLGTYSDRPRDIEFLCGQTDHLPFGGEVVIPNSSLHDIDKCTAEMFKLNLSYLNIEWNNLVIEKWKNSVYTEACGDDAAYYEKTAFTYIENRLGYRFVATGCTVENSDTLKVGVKVKNLGFGNLNKIKKCKLLFVKDGAVAAQVQAQDFNGGGQISAETQKNFGSGEFEVYLCVYGEERGGKPAYAIQFANENVWDGDLKANKVCTVVI